MDVIRAGEWWEYKLVPILAAFYGTVLILDVSLISLWRTVLILFLALAPGAAFVSVINDYTDKQDDLAAGKRNRMTGRPAWLVTLLIGVPVAAGITFALLWRRDVPLLTAYLGAWLAFSLYSIRPFRWKTRGILGVVADASGAHLFPTLVAVLLAFHDTARTPDPVWTIAVAGWSFAYGLRGILWHQLTDRDNDIVSAAGTFAARHSPDTVARIGTYGIFPVEIVSLGVMLWRIGTPIPTVFLAFYGLAAHMFARKFDVNLVVVRPRERFRILLHDYYDVLLPFGILIAASLRHPRDLLALGIHLLLFPRRAAQVARDLLKLIFQSR